MTASDRRRKSPKEESGREGASPLFAPLPEGPFRTIVADPPWDYSRKLSGGGTSGYSPVHHSRGGSRGAANHYKTLGLNDLMQLPVGDIAADESHLYLWTTGTFLVEAHELAAAWGFSPKGVIPWVKTTSAPLDAIAKTGQMGSAVRMGMGRYIRWTSEFVLFAVRGKLPTLRNDARGIVFAPVRRHSEKPEEMYDLIRSLSPEPRLDIFARSVRSGFSTWGDEAPEPD